MKSATYTFRRAVPVWESGTETEMNRHVCFTVKLAPTLESPVLSLSGSTSFTVSINGQFIAHGPARCAHGFYRVDQIALAKYLTSEESILSIRVAGYYARAYSSLRQPSFLCAELTDGDTVVAYTAPQEGGFSAYAVGERIQRVQRYSYERPFVEHYQLTSDAFSYEYGKGKDALPLVAVGEKHFLVRTQPYSDYSVVLPKGEVAEGVVSYSDKDSYFTDAAITGPQAGAVDGYPEEELAFLSYREVGRMDFCRTASFFCRSAQAISLSTDGYADIDLGCNYTGILDFMIETPGGCELFILFDERFGPDGSIDPFRTRSSNIFYYKLAAGQYHLHTCEVYAMRALRLIVRSGAGTVKGLKLFKIGFPARLFAMRPAGNQEGLGRLFDAACETFSACAADLYMDTPGRTRAPWLRDSFFIARVEKTLTGAARLERTFLENFLLPDTFPGDLPAGMLPMCYPSDSYGPGQFSPARAMWFVLELEEHLARSGEQDLATMAKERLYALLAFFRPYENGDGLLEQLPGRGLASYAAVSFPLNMLYAKMKETVAYLYADAELGIEAAALREAIRHLALRPDGFFSEGLVYNRDGRPVHSGELTEACQYYAFFTGTATPQTDGPLWQALCNSRGPAGVERDTLPVIVPMRDEIDRYLRFDLLCRYGCHEQLLQEIEAYFSPMIAQSGSLWKGNDTQADCHGGAAAHLLVWLDQAGYLVRD